MKIPLFALLVFITGMYSTQAFAQGVEKHDDWWCYATNSNVTADELMAQTKKVYDVTARELQCEIRCAPAHPAPSEHECSFILQEGPMRASECIGRAVNFGHHGKPEQCH